VRHGLEIRNPKAPEERPKSEGRNPKAEGRLAAVALERGERPNNFAAPKSEGCVAGLGSDFGFRISAFFRASGFGLRVSAASFLFLATPALLTAATNTLDPFSSSLLPPRGEIPPTFWEQYGAWVILAAVFLVGAVAMVVWLATRPKPIVPVPWSVQAREQLEPLRHQAEDGIVLSRVSQILRQYVASAFGFPSGEATTSEFCRTLSGCEQIGPELSAEIGEFLKDCDQRKFAPGPPPLAPCDGVSRSLSIIEKAEKRLAGLRPAAAASSADSNSTRASKAGQEQGLASGA
jgi:hypothetical protein